MSLSSRIKHYIEAALFPEGKPHTNGTFIGMRVTPETAQAIQDYCKANNVPEPIDPEDMHVTICYSKKPVPDYPVDSKLRFTLRLPPGITRASKAIVNARKWDIFGDDKNCLVLKLKSNILNARHQKALDAGLTHTFPDFTPHITFSYGLPPGFDRSKLPLFDAPIHFCEEYKNGLVDKDDD